jgi:hypothetical protein
MEGRKERGMEGERMEREREKINTFKIHKAFFDCQGLGTSISLWLKSQELCCHSLAADSLFDAGEII